MILDLSKLKVICRPQLQSDSDEEFLFHDRVENIVGKGENAGYQHFLLFRQCL